MPRGYAAGADARLPRRRFFSNAVLPYYSIYCVTAALSGMLAGRVRARVRDRRRFFRVPGVVGMVAPTWLRAGRAMTRGVHVTVTADILCNV